MRPVNGLFIVTHAVDFVQCNISDFGLDDTFFSLSDEMRVQRPATLVTMPLPSN